MDTPASKEPGYVKAIKICAIYIFPIIIVTLITIILAVPAPKN